MFKRVCGEAGIGDSWTPRELRTSFVSLMSHRGVSIEEIARLVGHTSTRTTERLVGEVAGKRRDRLADLADHRAVAALVRPGDDPVIDPREFLRAVIEVCCGPTP